MSINVPPIAFAKMGFPASSAALSWKTNMLQSAAEGVYTGLTIGLGTIGPGPNVAALALAAGITRASAAVTAANAARGFRDMIGRTSLECRTAGGGDSRFIDC
jgi:hypothetical protein